MVAPRSRVLTSVMIFRMSSTLSNGEPYRAESGAVGSLDAGKTIGRGDHRFAYRPIGAEVPAPQHGGAQEVEGEFVVVGRVGVIC